MIRCLMCGGFLGFLGQLGKLLHFRCQNCGIGVALTKERAEERYESTIDEFAD